LLFLLTALIVVRLIPWLFRLAVRFIQFVFKGRRAAKYA
jgi:hypothetical protein